MQVISDIGDALTVWEVIGSYESHDHRRSHRWSHHPGVAAGSGANRGSPEESDPLLRPPEINWSGHKYQEPYDQDTKGRLVMNSAKDPLDPKPMRDRTHLICTITRNEPSPFPAGKPLVYNDTCNLDTVSIAGNSFPAGSVKCDLISGLSQFENDLFFFRVTYQLSMRRKWSPDPAKVTLHYPTGDPGGYGATPLLASGTTSAREGWDDIFADVGLKEWPPQAAGVQREKQAIKVRDTGVQITRDTPLDGDGADLRRGIPGGGGYAQFHYLIFQPYERTDFSKLKLPQ